MICSNDTPQNLLVGLGAGFGVATASGCLGGWAGMVWVTLLFAEAGRVEVIDTHDSLLTKGVHGGRTSDACF